MLIAFNKPFDTLSQFSRPDNLTSGVRTLADFIDQPAIYPAGRLDRDSEGLLLLTDNGPLQHRLSHPRHGHWKGYWLQLEGHINERALQQLRQGVPLRDGLSKPARACRIMEPPGLWARDPPIRQRAIIPTSWIALHICEGRNRQVRRMSAAVGFPTLRLIRFSCAGFELGKLAPGSWREVSEPTFEKHNSGQHRRQQQEKNKRPRLARQRRQQRPKR